jgi:hypothetical protein
LRYRRLPNGSQDLLEASPWRHSEESPVYFEEAADECALFTFSQAERLVNENAFHDQACAVNWPAPARIKVSAQAVRSLDDFLADAYAAWVKHKLRLTAISLRHGPVLLSAEERAADRANWLEASRPTKGEMEYRR